MKKREDMEWKLFELLEDELSASEEAEILAQMEDDETLEEEWTLLQSTKLAAPEVTYANKKSLLKKETTVLAFAGVNWLRYAAILAIVAGTYPLWKTVIFSDDVEGLVGNATEIVEPHHATETPDQNQPLEKLTDNAQSDAVVETTVTNQETGVAVNSTPIKKQVAQKGQPSGTTRPVGIEKPQNNDLNALVRIDPQYVVVTPRPDVVIPIGDYRKPQISAPVNFSPEWFARMDLDLTAEEDNNTNQYRGIRPALNSGLAWVTSPFRNSKVSVKPVPGNFKALQFTYTNSQYEATAMVSLTPIKD